MQETSSFKSVCSNISTLDSLVSLANNGAHVHILATRRTGNANMWPSLARSFPVTGPQPLSSLRRAGNRASRPRHRALAQSSLLRDWFPSAGAVLSLAQTHSGRPQTTSTRLYAGGELQGSPVWQALSGHKRRIPLAVVLPPPARGAGFLIPSAQRLVWAAKQPLGKAALGALFA